MFWHANSGGENGASPQKTGLSQIEVAARLGISPSNISRWENDGAEDIKAQYLRTLLSLYGVSEAYLRGQSDEASSLETVKPLGTPERKNLDWMARVSDALAKAFRYGEHTLDDVDAVRELLRDARHFPAGLQLDRAAPRWLQAAATLRRAGQPVTAAHLLLELDALT